MQPISEAIQKKYLAVLAGVSFLTVLLMSWGFRPRIYNADFLLYMCRSASVHDLKGFVHNIFSPDGDFRFRPGIFFTFQMEYLLFGIAQGGYYALSLLIHAANCFAVFFLCRNFGANLRMAFIAACLFLTSFLNWGSLINVTDIVRFETLLFYLLGVFAFSGSLQRAKASICWDVLLFYLMVLLTAEDGITFPLMLIVIAVYLPDIPYERRFGKEVRRTIFLTLVLAFLSVAYVKLFVAGHSYVLYYGWHSLQKLIILPRDILQHLFIPRLNWGLPKARYVPLMILGISCSGLLLSMPEARRKEFLKSHKAIIFLGLGWIAVAIIPYLARPTGWAWVSRYFYFLSPGIFILLAVMLEACYLRVIDFFSRRWISWCTAAFVLVYLMLFGVFSTILLYHDICGRMKKVAPVGYKEASLFLGLLPQVLVLDQKERGGITLTVRGNPFSQERLQELLDGLPYLKNTIKIAGGKFPFSGKTRAHVVRFTKGTWMVDHE